MTDSEKLMYELLNQISSTDAPIIFKGGLITNLILENNNYHQVQRATIDIDANWIDKAPSMEYLIDTINTSLGELGTKYEVKPYREYGSKKSAGLSLIDKDSQTKIVTMDIEIMPTLGSKIYHYGSMSIKGVLANEIIADKISSISSDAIYKYRAKDLIDLYALSHCSTINTKDIYETSEKRGHPISTFDGLLNHLSDVEHAYNKLKRIENKPDFSVLYPYISVFLKPFINKDIIEKIWNPSTHCWNNLKELNKNRFSRAAQKSFAEKAAKQPMQQQKDKSKDDIIH